MFIWFCLTSTRAEREICISCIEQSELKGSAVERALRLQGWELTHWISSLLTRRYGSLVWRKYDPFSSKKDNNLHAPHCQIGESTRQVRFRQSCPDGIRKSHWDHFSILGRNLWGVARRSQAGPITFTRKNILSTIFNILSVFQHSKIQHPPDTACCKCSMLHILDVSVSAMSVLAKVWISISTCRPRSVSSMASKCPWASFCVPEPRFSASPGAWFDNWKKERDHCYPTFFV